jgi:RNA 2',3'-cyclic 3'-phosphodiesterase
MDKDNSKIRLFTGIPLDDRSRIRVADIASGLSEHLSGARWVDPVNYHVTLKFLGSCETAIIENAKPVIQGLSEFLPFTLEIGEVGAFPSVGSARIIWVGSHDVEGKAEKAYRVLDKGFAHCGIDRDKRKYHPHITIGRSRNKPVKITPDMLIPHQDKSILVVDRIVLYESSLMPKGAEYRIIEEIGPGAAKWPEQPGG